MFGDSQHAGQCALQRPEGLGFEVLEHWVDKSRAKQLDIGLPHVTETRGQRQHEMRASSCLLFACFPRGTRKVPSPFQAGVIDWELRRHLEALLQQPTQGICEQAGSSAVQAAEPVGWDDPGWTEAETAHFDGLSARETVNPQNGSNCGGMAPIEKQFVDSF